MVNRLLLVVTFAAREKFHSNQISLLCIALSYQSSFMPVEGSILVILEFIYQFTPNIVFQGVIKKKVQVLFSSDSLFICYSLLPIWRLNCLVMVWFSLCREVEGVNSLYEGIVYYMKENLIEDLRYLRCFWKYLCWGRRGDC